METKWNFWQAFTNLCRYKQWQYTHPSWDFNSDEVTGFGARFFLDCCAIRIRARDTDEVLYDAGMFAPLFFIWPCMLIRFHLGSPK